jgi:hypothetical protein
VNVKIKGNSIRCKKTCTADSTLLSQWFIVLAKSLRVDCEREKPLREEYADSGQSITDNASKYWVLFLCCITPVITGSVYDGGFYSFVALYTRGELVSFVDQFWKR